MSDSVKKKSNNPTGRPKGSSNKIRVTDFFNGDERDELIMNAKMLAFGDREKDIRPDKDMIKFCWEQLFGKATQRTEITGAEGDALQIIFDNSFNK
jgi:hypothetical protein